jgi:hypothetical protein
VLSVLSSVIKTNSSFKSSSVTMKENTQDCLELWANERLFRQNPKMGLERIVKT